MLRLATERAVERARVVCDALSELERQVMQRLSWIWDYDIDDATFQAILDGGVTLGRLGRDWAAVRLLDYAPWSEVVHRLGLRELVKNWPTWRTRVRSASRRRGLDFLVEWLPGHRADLL